MRTRTVAHLTTGLVLTFGFLAEANALPQLRLTTSTGDTITVLDGGANDSAAGVDGLVVYNGPLGSWNINVTTGVSKPALGTESIPLLDLMSLNMTSGTGGSITLELTDTGFASQPDLSQVATQIGGTTTGAVSFRTFFDAANQAFGQGTELTNATYGTGAFSGTGWNTMTALNPFSLTLLVTLTHDNRDFQISSFDAGIQVPEPASLLLVGLGLLGLAVSLRRRSAFAL